MGTKGVECDYILRRWSCRWQGSPLGKSSLPLSHYQQSRTLELNFRTEINRGNKGVFPTAESPRKTIFIGGFSCSIAARIASLSGISLFHSWRQLLGKIACCVTTLHRFRFHARSTTEQLEIKNLYSLKPSVATRCSPLKTFVFLFREGSSRELRVYFWFRQHSYSITF